MYSQGMNDIAAPILIVFLLDIFKLNLEQLEAQSGELAQTLEEETLLPVRFSNFQVINQHNTT